MGLYSNQARKEGRGGIERTLVSEPDADAVFRSATLDIDGGRAEEIVKVNLGQCR